MKTVWIVIESYNTDTMIRGTYDTEDKALAFIHSNPESSFANESAKVLYVQEYEVE